MSEPQVDTIKIGELNCWRISSDDAELTISQQGAQVIAYQRKGQQPLIWSNPDAVFKQGTAVRGGVPVCWPWFGNLARNPQAVQAEYRAADAAPSHGLVRALDWALLGIEQTQHGLQAQFTATAAAEGKLAGWPHKVAVTLTVLLNDTLRLSLTSRNLGTEAVTLSQALHSYFAVSDVRQVRVEGLDGLTYIETLDGWQSRAQQGDLHFASETDRIYLNTPQTLSFVDAAWQRRVVLTSSRSHTAVVWNPWIDRAAQLSDMADDGWQGMLCIETANVWDDVVSLAPGAEHSMSITIDSQPLD